MENSVAREVSTKNIRIKESPVFTSDLATEHHQQMLVSQCLRLTGANAKQQGESMLGEGKAVCRCRKKLLNLSFLCFSSS